MKYLTFNKENGECNGVYDEPLQDSIEYNFNPETQYLHSLKLVNNKIVFLYPGLSIEDQRKQFNKDKEAADLEIAKKNKLPIIKAKAADKIKELDWKLERAKEQDLMSSTKNDNSRTLVILKLRQDIRDASSALELKVMECATMNELNQINLSDF